MSDFTIKIVTVVASLLPFAIIMVSIYLINKFSNEAKILHGKTRYMQGTRHLSEEIQRVLQDDDSDTAYKVRLAIVNRYNKVLDECKN